MFDEVAGGDGVECLRFHRFESRGLKFERGKSLARNGDGGVIDVNAQRPALHRGEPCRKLARVAPDVENAPAGLGSELGEDFIEQPIVRRYAVMEGVIAVVA